MRILFACAHPYLPQIAGGTQSNTHEMAGELLARGHEIAVLTGLMGKGWTGLRGRISLKLLRRQAAVDRGLGYPVYRTWFAWEGAAEAARHFRPDVVIAQSGQILRMAAAFRAAGVPTVLYFHNVEFDDHGGPIEAFRGSVCLANSVFTARKYAEAFGINAGIINPLFQAARYRVQSSRERVLFVNPHPLKGVDLALDLAAACPEIPFDFVESWTLSEEQRSALAARATALGNVTLHARTNNMRQHYGRARLVLVPSRWEETWGRVASEAHFSGIPALATRIGGLEEAVGPGGVLLDPGASVADWAAGLRRMWVDTDHYAGLSAAALAYSARPQLDVQHQLDALLGAANAAVEGERHTPTADAERLVS